MDLADACLVRMTELHADCELITIDREFRDVYRRRGRQVIPTLMPAGPKS
jgi:rRNA-processing protein FCF1